jgi:Cu(I)/Ag(I) efflux system membrane fusion protein
MIAPNRHPLFTRCRSLWPARSRRWLSGPLLLAAGLILGCELESAPTETYAEAAGDTALEHTLKHLDPKYVCPMHPQIVRDEPGSCPICGMALVEKQVSAGEGGDEGPPIVRVRPETLQNMGVRTAQAERATLWKYIRTVGYVGYDEDRLVHVHPRAEGWVERMLVRAEGDRVKRGQVLLRFYSPEIMTAQSEYLIALDKSAVGLRGRANPQLVEGARRRLRLLHVPGNVIDRLKRTREVQRTVPVLSPAEGVVTKLGFREGMFVTPATELYSIGDLSEVWVLVDVFEHQLDWLEKGKPAEIRVAAVPGRIWEGEVDYIYPELDPKTRTLRARLRFANPDGRLKPNMLAEVTVYAGPKKDVLSIPREALILTGQREAVVVALGEGRFQAVDVVGGMHSGDRVEILEGLEEGDRVVVSGQFLIDSESNLQAGFQRFGGQ